MYKTDKAIQRIYWICHSQCLVIVIVRGVERVSEYKCNENTLLN